MNNGGDAAGAGVSYSGVSLVGEAGGQLRTVDGLTLQVDPTGITITGPSPDRVNSVPWDSVLDIAPGESDAFPDGRPATVVGLSLPGRSVRLLVPAEQLAPAEVATFSSYGPGTPPAPAPAPAPAPSAPAPTAGFTTDQINQLLSAARPSAPAPAAAPPPPPGSLPPGYAPAPAAAPGPSPLPAGYAQPPLPAGYAPLPAGYAQPPRPAVPSHAPAAGVLPPGAVIRPAGSSGGGGGGKRGLLLGIVAVVVVAAIVVGAVFGLKGSNNNKLSGGTSTTTSTTKAPVTKPGSGPTTQPPSNLQGPSLVANTDLLAPTVNITAHQLPPRWVPSPGCRAGTLVGQSQGNQCEKTGLGSNDAQSAMSACVSMQPSHLQLLFQDAVPGGPPTFVSTEYSPISDNSVPSNTSPGNQQITDAFSGVSFVSDADTERADMAVVTSTTFLSCFVAFERALTAYEFESLGAAVDSVTATVLPTRLHPGVQALAIQLNSTIVIGGVNYPLETLFLIAGAGRAEGYVQLDSSPASYPSTLWQDIVNVYLGRLATVASPGKK